MKILLLLTIVVSFVLVAKARPLFMDTILNAFGLGDLFGGTGWGGGYPAGGGGYPLQPGVGGGYPPQPGVGGGYPLQPGVGSGYPLRPGVGGGSGAVPAASNCIPQLCVQRCHYQGYRQGGYCSFNQCMYQGICG